jgi:hypothetical protein
VAEELKRRTPYTPTLGLGFKPEALYTGPSGLPMVELTSLIDRVPFTPF